jgi:hypothetical protein
LGETYGEEECALVVMGRSGAIGMSSHAGGLRGDTRTVEAVTEILSRYDFKRVLRTREGYGEGGWRGEERSMEDENWWGFKCQLVPQKSNMLP